MPHQFVLATQNQGKVKEIRILLEAIPIEICPLSDFPGFPDVVEDGTTLEENALKKAREIFEFTGLPAIADDSGLEVFSLNMAPGVYSARYAGEHVSYADNNNKLLLELAGKKGDERKAQFRCVAALVSETEQKIFEGICAGQILETLRGTEGFGYDPLFQPKGYNQTFAELSVQEKNTMSHRAKAFNQLKEYLLQHYSTV